MDFNGHRAKSASIYLPGKESWYDLRTGTAYKGGKIYKLDISEENIPAFQRAGTIVPRRDRFRRSSTQMMHDPFTLMIALNSSQAVEGELYLDDGKSFDFSDGAYIHRHFVFSEGHLTSSNMASSTIGNSRFSTDCIIERIILLGYTPGAKTALIEPGNHKAEIELGPLRLGGQHCGAAVTIRKPGVRVAEDWNVLPSSLACHW